MKDLFNYLRKEMVLKLDFERMEFKIGYVWVVIILLKIIF
jgi:hypothetical protein